MDNNRANLVPLQNEGGRTGATEKVETKTREEAITLYAKAKKRMQDINNWKNIANGGSAAFCLTDAEGNRLEREPQSGDFIRIDIPGPGPRSGKGYDWVRIEAIESDSNLEKDEDFYGFRTRPVKSPFAEKETSTHFYTSDATSSFILHRIKTRVLASEQGRNEIPNMDTEKVNDSIRNAAVALGAMFGLAVPQWKNLMQGILKPD